MKRTTPAQIQPAPTAAIAETTQQTCADWMQEVPDPRLPKRTIYPLPEILFVLFVGQLCGMEDIDETVLFAKLNLPWFRKIMPFQSGIAPAQTIRRVLARLDTKAFEKLFTSWSAQWTAPGVIAIDGKCLRGASDYKNTHAALYTVSAFSDQSGLVLGQHKVHDKSNEITAIPALLDQLTIAGNIITIDAMGTQSKIAKLICKKGGDYILALKGNQSTLRDDVARFFDDEVSKATCSTYTATNSGHGRIEERTIHVSDDIEWLRQLHPQWENLRSIIAITSTRTIKKTGLTTAEIRYYITSLAPDPNLLLESIRAHWRIENTLHWSLDVIFGEDKSRLRRENIAANMAVIRKAAFNVLRQEQTKLSLKLKRLNAAQDSSFRSSLINLNHS